MANLNFRIVFVPKRTESIEKKEFILVVKNAVQNCGVRVISINYSQVKKSEDEAYPEIEELSVFIHADGISYPEDKVAQYKEFCHRWEKQSVKLPCSYVVLYQNDSFRIPEKLHISQSFEIEFDPELSFGVLPHNGFYYEYTPNYTLDSVDFYHDTRYVIITYGEFELSFSYDNISLVFVNISNSNELFLHLFNPPMIFRRETVTKGNHDSYVLKHRNLNLSAPLSGDDLMEYRKQLRDCYTKKCIVFGRRKSWQIFDFPEIDEYILGRANVLKLNFANSDIVQKIIDGIHFHCSEKSVHYSSISTVTKTKPEVPVLVNMPFGCAYLITAILKRNFIVAAQSSDISYNLMRLDTLSRQNSDCLEKALTSVLAALDSGKILNFWQAIETQYGFYLTNKDEMNVKKYIVPPNCLMIRRVTLTPTRQLLWPPELMYGNRVLRNFKAEYALRISFRDDNMSRMSFNATHADPPWLDSCIKNPMTSGIRIGSRHYEFLGWSNSQIRDHGVWMYAKDTEGSTVTTIRKWMGDFSHIHNVPKYMARMGQCFSQTEDTLSVPFDPQYVRIEADIERGQDPVNGKPYCFSDGVGRISTNLANRVHKTLGHDKLCSAFQIRYSGSKGMLVIDPTLQDAQIVFRKSMVKFHSLENTSLEIARTSSPAPLQLNRQFITLLNHLGVRHRTFLKLQEDFIKSLTDMLYNENEAAEFLTSKTPSGLYNYKELSDSGVHLTMEPFFKSLLLALHRHHIENIKSKANIPIDPSFGRNMLGVMDETGFLSYGEVFVQYTTDISHGETTRKTTILKGEVLVTKNPCTHPGDVRKFKAVDIPRLHHIVDCIVFPKQGPRPHPNEMAGSDLDGDEYAVLWFKDLIFRGPNREPAHFPDTHSEDVPSIKVEHMIDFLQTYIHNDQVGAIGNAHLAHADAEEDGVDSEICLNIAKKFSVAVDFAKNGKSQHLEKNERPTKYPDFMENNNKEVYKSKKALGKMYRVCKDFETENQETSIAYHDIKVDPDLVYEGWQKYEDIAIKARNKYNEIFRSVLANYGIQHEVEALSAAFTNLHCRFHERKDRNEIEKVVIGCVKHLQKSMRQELLEEFANAADVATTEEKILQKASACYVVTYSDPEAKFLSFPWILSRFLSNIKIRKASATQPAFPPVILNLDKRIYECVSKSLLPYYIETNIWNEYIILCDPTVVKHALRTLMLWAQDEEIIEGPGQSRGLMFATVFIKLFLHVANLLGYVTKRKNHGNQTRTTFSPGDLCLEFLKFCSSFRFYHRNEIGTILPFEIKYYSKFGKRAIVSYHRFALTGRFQNLYFDAKTEGKLIQMKPIQIDSRIFPKTPINGDSLRIAEKALIKYSKVEQLSLREIQQTKKVCVSARGSDLAVRALKSILRKKHVFLRELFQTGIMPDTGMIKLEKNNFFLMLIGRVLKNVN